MKKSVLICAPRFYGIDESIRQSFEDVGFNAVLKSSRIKLTFQEVFAKKLGNVLPFAKYFLNPILKFYLDQENQEFITFVKARNPDLIFIIKGEQFFPETLQKLKKETSACIAAYIWDDPFYSYAGRFIDDYRKNNFARGMHLYDYIFVYDPYYVEEIRKRGILKVSYLPLATDPNKYKRIDVTKEENQKYGFDVCFVGRPFPNRIEIFENLSEFKLGVFGDGWEEWFRTKTPNYFKGKALNEKVLKVYNSSKIILNIHDPEAICGVNTRTFDILSCGAFELVDYKSELERLFKEGEEIMYYKDIADLKRLIKYYLDNPKERNNIAEKGKMKVLNSHTWDHRIKEVIHILHTAGFVFK
ncbi:MAG: glycosyltransferase [Planctomycetes bacterium]|nr:glycosyltransferase [Planctomycetota bacterium]